MHGPLAPSWQQLQQSLIFEHAEVVFPGFKLMRSKGFGLEAGWRKFDEPAVRCSTCAEWFSKFCLWCMSDLNRSR